MVSTGFADLEAQYGTARSKGAKVLLEELEVQYKNPVNLAFSPDGREVWTACEASGSVVIVDAATRRKLAEITVGGQADGRRLQPRRPDRLRHRTGSTTPCR